MQSARQPTKQALIDAAIAALAGNPGASLSEIAVRAGVGRATLHRYFPTRDDLIRELTLESIRATDDASRERTADAKTAEEKLLRMLEAVVPLGDRFHFLMSESRTGDSEVSEKYSNELDWVAHLVDDLKREGTIAREIPTAWAVTTIDALIWRAWSEIHDGRIARADAAALVHRTLLKGLGP